LAFELPLPSPGHTRPGAGQPEADAGLGNDLDQAGAPAGQMLCHSVVEILGPAGVVAGMLIALVEMEQVQVPSGWRRVVEAEVEGETQGVVGVGSALTAGPLPALGPARQMTVHPVLLAGLTPGGPLEDAVALRACRSCW
jgi:hypothetical protein